MNEPITKLEVDGRTFDVYTLPSYVTPYYYVKEFGGSINHFLTLRKLKNHITRAMKARKLGKL